VVFTPDRCRPQGCFKLVAPKKKDTELNNLQFCTGNAPSLLDLFLFYFDRSGSRIDKKKCCSQGSKVLEISNSNMSTRDDKIEENTPLAISTLPI
jgi:hypothetical protein